MISTELAEKQFLC